MFDVFSINGRDYSILAAGVVVALIYFVAQLAFCLKAKKIAIKLIPLYVFFIPVIYCALLGFGAFGRSYGNAVFALFLVLIIRISAIGEILAWVVYGHIRHRRNQK